MRKKFKVVSMGRVGTLAMNRFINNHPEICLPSFKEAARIFADPKENIAKLLEGADHSEKVNGIIIHSPVFLDKKNRRALTKLNNIKTDALLHLVRNPMEQVKSWINHINASAEIGILGWGKIPPTAKGLFEQYPQHFATVKSGMQCRTFYKGSSNIKLIDFPSLSNTNVHNTMAGIFNFLGVDDYDLGEMIQQPQNNYTRELLSRGLHFKLNGETVKVFMAPVNLFFHDDKGIKPWVTIHDTQKIYKLCPTLPPMDGDLLFGAQSNDEFNKLSFKTRKMVSEGIQDILGEILPVWAKQAEDIAQKIEANKLVNLREQDIDFIKDTLKDDMEIFKRYHPEVQAKWGF
ncbi:hypothetical protein [Paraglaciecola sp. L3A3]|uniref:hypothetical protein n=1 Tax=Paraglaciecola sp. L3A3 TaxID=2686358 RepID=UPI00131D5C05|nr:hypothetical protein [Paraglaciecola sp. L3A3]